MKRLSGDGKSNRRPKRRGWMPQFARKESLPPPPPDPVDEEIDEAVALDLLRLSRSKSVSFEYMPPQEKTKLVS